MIKVGIMGSSLQGEVVVVKNQSLNTNVINTPNVNVNQLTPFTVATGAGVSASANTNILSSNYTPPQLGKSE